MTEALPVARANLPAAPRINALQNAWLLELGVPKAWVVQPSRAGQGTVKAAPALSERPAPSADITQSSPPLPGPQRAGVEPTRPAPQARPVVARAEAPAVIQRLPGVADSADMTELSEKVQTCEACGLCHTRGRAVFGSGAMQADWMVIGEAPGEKEDTEALPFVGKSGQLLTQMLNAVGVDRDRDVFITNVIKCRPPGNRNPKADEIEACKPVLLRQIELVAPRRLLVLGRFAAQVLLGSDANLNALRGRVHTFVDGTGRGIPMVVSYHPAYLLRSPLEKARAWHDLVMARASVAQDGTSGVDTSGVDTSGVDTSGAGTPTPA